MTEPLSAIAGILAIAGETEKIRPGENVSYASLISSWWELVPGEVVRTPEPEPAKGQMELQ